jgi:hypothetical protein
LGHRQIAPTVDIHSLVAARLEKHRPTRQSLLAITPSTPLCISPDLAVIPSGRLYTISRQSSSSNHGCVSSLDPLGLKPFLDRSPCTFSMTLIGYHPHSCTCLVPSLTCCSSTLLTFCFLVEVSHRSSFELCASNSPSVFVNVANPRPLCVRGKSTTIHSCSTALRFYRAGK